MDKFQYEIYNKQIESLKDTKKPLKDIINKLFKDNFYLRKISLDTINSDMFVIILILKAVKFSSLVHPLTKEQQNDLEYGFRNIISTGTLTDEQILELFEYSPFSINLFPETLAEYRIYKGYEKVLNKIDKQNSIYVGRAPFNMFSKCSMHTILTPIDAEFYEPDPIDTEKAKQNITILEQSIADLTELKDKLHEYISTDE